MISSSLLSTTGKLDPLIHTISKMKGYTLRAKRYNHATLNVSKQSLNISVAAYMDDSSWIADSKGYLQKILDKANSFNTMAQIKANPTKSYLVCFNTGKKEPVKYHNMEIKLTNDTPVRYLGIWIKQDKNQTFQKQLITEMANKFMRKIA